LVPTPARFSSLEASRRVTNAIFSRVFTCLPVYTVNYVANTEGVASMYGDRFRTEVRTRGCYWFPRRLA
jgi:hypothetical protein